MVAILSCLQCDNKDLLKNGVQGQEKSARILE